jgi:eukaryotic-like serine/threonine-protein kinase
LVGQTIAGRYHVLRVVAEGGMGIVYEAEQSMGEGVRRVAIKTLLPDLSRDPVVVSRFSRECSVVAGLEHPNTVRVYDFGSTGDGTLYIAMEFVNGRPLGDVIAEGMMPLPRCIGITEQIASALEEAHDQGIVHRDLKPDNLVLCERAGLHDFVKVLDFGIAKRSSVGGRRDTHLTQQGMVLGTPPYMSPEQFAGEELDRTSDVYSLGIIIYEMLNSKLPFDGDTPWQWAHQHMSVTPAPFLAPIPQEVQQVVFAALSKNRGGRPASAIELYRRLVTASGCNRGLASTADAPVNVQYAGPVAFAKGDTCPDVAPLGVRTEPSMVRDTPYPTMLRDASGAAGLPAGTTGFGPLGTKTAVVGRATELGTPGLALAATSSGAAMSHGVGPSGRRRSPRRLGRQLAMLASAVVALGATVGAVWWQMADSDAGGTPPPPSTAIVEPAAANIAAESAQQQTASGYVELPSLSAPSSHYVSAQGNPRPNAAASANHPTSAATPQPAPATSAASPPANPFQIPLPIALPSILTPLGFPPAAASNSTTPSSSPSPAPAQPAASPNGMQNCTEASALASTDLDAAVSKCQACESAVGRTAASPTRAQIAAIGTERARTLAAQGNCVEANRVAQTLARIGVHRPALAAIHQAGC